MCIPQAAGLWPALGNRPFQGQWCAIEACQPGTPTFSWSHQCSSAKGMSSNSNISSVIDGASSKQQRCATTNSKMASSRLQLDGLQCFCVLTEQQQAVKQCFCILTKQQQAVKHGAILVLFANSKNRLQQHVIYVF